MPEPPAANLSRRLLLRLAGIGSLGAAALAASKARGAAQAYGGHATAGHAEGQADRHAGHLAGAVGRVTSLDPDPSVYLRSFNFSHLPPNERARFYRETPIAGPPEGKLLREY